MRQHKQKFLLLVILLLAFFLRFYRLADNPPSLNWDEVSHGYNAYSILKTGKDEWGIKWPMIFRAYGDYKLPVYIYLTVVSIKLFGLNEFAVRFPSAILGVLGVLGVFGLAKELFANSFASPIPQPFGLKIPNPKGFSLARLPLVCLASLIAAFLLAVEPWGLFLSRVAVEANVVLCLIISGTYFFLRGLRSSKFLVLSSLFFGLSLFTYNSARVFVPLLVLSLVWIHKERVKRDRGDKKMRILAGLVFLGFLGMMLVSVFSSSGQARFKWVTLIDEGAIQQINQVRGQSVLPGILPRLFYNKGTYFVSQFSKNYLAHFSPNFLFFKGGSHYQFNIPNHGLLYPINFPLILVGLWCLLKDKNRGGRTILAWLFLAPVASSITRDSPHTLRAIVMLPIWQILAAIGVIRVIGIFREFEGKKTLKVGIITCYLLLVTSYWFSYWRVYFGPYRKDYSWAWQYGYKQTVEFIKDNYERYDKIIVTKKYGEPHEFVLFYWPWDPEEYRSDPNLVRYFQTDWYWVDSFDKFEFVNDWEVKKVGSEEWGVRSGKSLLITNPGNYPEGWEKVETIYFLDGKPAFEILEN